MVITSQIHASALPDRAQPEKGRGMIKGTV